tara:strand:+ start:2785 stop:3246 length:462 start_codon:yes stop_codon:yes gene_type:complete
MFKKLLILFIIISGCTTNKVVKNHGISLIDEKSKKLIINQSNKNDILKIMGPPSTKSEFNENIWIYIERKKTSSSIFKLGNRKLVKNNILIVELNGFGILEDKKMLNIQNMNKISFEKQITTSGYTKNSYMYNLLTSLRHKINSPSERKRVSD